MSTILLPIPQNYGRVLLTASAALVLSTVHSFSIGLYFRPRAHILLPQLYATAEQVAADPNAYVYNCAQRAHANYVENLFPAVGAMLLGGLRNPQTATWWGLGWMGMRLAYLWNYTRSSGVTVVHGRPPMGMGTAMGVWVCQFALYVHAIRAAWDVYVMGS
jgi:glutathione S-transferase